ncbi:hypothetical protein Tco_0782025 [Tanacetum coccineum]
MTITRSGMTPEAIEELVNRRVEEALAAHEATRAANALEAENQSQNGSDGDNGNGGNGNGENGNGGNGNPKWKSKQNANPKSNVIKGAFLLNNHYASMIFDSGADRSFVSTTFSTLLDITPDTLDVSYAVELADGRISETNTILRANHHAVIICDEKIMRIPFGDEVLIVQGDRDGKGEKSKVVH